MKSTNKNLNNDFQALIETAQFLRSENGCPWDKDQDSASLEQYLLQETYEVLEAIDNNDYENLKEELGDLMFQIILQCIIMEEEEKFSLVEVINSVNQKLIKRHPHVFGEKQSDDMNTETVEKQWGELKKKESKSNAEYLRNITETLPTLSFAFALIKKTADLEMDIDSSIEFDKKTISELIEIQFKISSAASKKNIDLENEYRKYLKVKQLDIIKQL